MYEGYDYDNVDVSGKNWEMLGTMANIPFKNLLSLLQMIDLKWTSVDCSNLKISIRQVTIAHSLAIKQETYSAEKERKANRIPEADSWRCSSRFEAFFQTQRVTIHTVRRQRIPIMDGSLYNSFHWVMNTRLRRTMRCAFDISAVRKIWHTYFFSPPCLI